MSARSSYEAANAPRRDCSGPQGKSAFTLAELLAVVGAIVIAGAVAWPPADALRRQGSKQAQCMANLRTIGAALFAYADDNNRELPGYSTMGRHAFRIAPGRRLDDVSPQEAWGVQAVLESGHAPPIYPNGLAYYTETVPPAYLDGNSEAWVCPANPGPTMTPGAWADYGSTYAYRTMSTGTYNLDELAGDDDKRANPLVWDNYSWYPGFPAIDGPFGPDFVVPTDQRQAPHHVGHREFWIEYSARGHCVKRSWTNPGPPH